MVACNTQEAGHIALCISAPFWGFGSLYVLVCHPRKLGEHVE